MSERTSSAPPALDLSAHGGHSGEFCCHARDRLEEIVERYVELGFRWVGLTEHQPAVDDDFLYPDERAAGLDAAATRERFVAFVDTARRLQRRFVDRLEIRIGIESEAYRGAFELTARLYDQHRLDYVVGSVHHVVDLPIDTSEADWRRACDAVGGKEALWCRYLERQAEMIEALRPAVVGHLDLVRLFDPDPAARLRAPAVHRRLEANLRRIRVLGLRLDLNSRALAKGLSEPYPARPIVERAIELGIALLPGDDSHGVDDVARGYAHLATWLASLPPPPGGWPAWPVVPARRS